MGQVLHGSATTTEAIRRAIQHSQKSLRALAKHYGINQKTVAKWKKRTSVADLPTGPKESKSTVLSIEDEAVVVAFRKHMEARKSVYDRRLARETPSALPVQSAVPRVPALAGRDDLGLIRPRVGRAALPKSPPRRRRLKRFH
jgi:transposase-like protein